MTILGLMPRFYSPNVKLLNRQLRDVLVFVLLNQDADNFHERGKRMRFVLTDLIDQGIEQGDKLPDTQLPNVAG